MRLSAFGELGVFDIILSQLYSIVPSLILFHCFGYVCHVIGYDNVHCEAAEDHELGSYRFWNATKAGATVIQACPEGAVGKTDKEYFYDKIA